VTTEVPFMVFCACIRWLVLCLKCALVNS